MSDTVIRQVVDKVWIFSKPFYRNNLIPFGGRSTAVQLNSGDVWVLASTPLTDETKEKLDSLGPVKYICAADEVHYLFVQDFQKAYSNAKVIGVEPLIAKLKGKVTFTGAYGKDPEGTRYGFEDEIEARYFPGFKNKDVAFLHKASKTLIQADLLLNLPATEQFSKTNSSGAIPLLSGVFQPYSAIYRKILGGLVTDSALMTRDAAFVAKWDFDRIIPCHGDVIETEGKKAWTTAYQAFLSKAA